MHLHVALQFPSQARSGQAGRSHATSVTIGRHGADVWLDSDHQDFPGAWTVIFIHATLATLHSRRRGFQGNHHHYCIERLHTPPCQLHTMMDAQRCPSFLVPPDSTRITVVSSRQISPSAPARHCTGTSSRTVKISATCLGAGARKTDSAKQSPSI